MSNLNPDLQKLNTIIEYGMFHQALSLMVDFCLRNGKKEALEKIKQWMLEVDHSLNPQEKEALKAEFSRLFQQKCQVAIQELKKNFSPEEIKTLLSQLLNQYLS
jgi:hypothetical protein